MQKAAGTVLVALLVAVVGCQETRGGSTATTTQSSNNPPIVVSGESPEGASALSGQIPAGQETTMPDGLKYQDLKVGDGALAESGKNVAVHYTGWLTDGTKFDSSLDRGEPFDFPLGGGQVIRGWDEGVKGMRVGGKRKLTIPPDLGYGDRVVGPIPAGSTLVFEVELLGVK
jgi:FKBP-type peptidyl-prolyl cis-trans isomerase